MDCVYCVLFHKAEAGEECHVWVGLGRRSSRCFGKPRLGWEQVGDLRLISMICT